MFNMAGCQLTSGHDSPFKDNEMLMLSFFNKKIVLLLLIVTTMMPLHALRAAITAPAMAADATFGHDTASMQASGCQMHQGNTADNNNVSVCGGAGCDMCGVCAVGPLPGSLQTTVLRSALLSYDTVTQLFPQTLPASHFRPPRI